MNLREKLALKLLDVDDAASVDVKKEKTCQSWITLGPITKDA